MNNYGAKLSFDGGPVEGAHMYQLPFCECPDCGIGGAASGLAYPWISGKDIFDSRTLHRLLSGKSGDTTWSEYLLYFTELREALPPDLPIAPGIGFGPWKGKVLSACEKLVLGVFDHLLADRRILDVLRKEGLNVETFEIELRPKGSYKPDLVEIFAPPVGLSCPSNDGRGIQTGAEGEHS